MNHRIRHLVVAGGVLAILILCVLSLVPGRERPHTGAPGQFEHLVAYALTAGFLSLAGRRAAIVAGLVVLAGALETAQLWIPGRTSQVIDFAASAAGAVLGVLLVEGIRRLVRSRRGSRPVH